MRVRFAIEFDAILGVFGIEPHVNEVFRQHPGDVAIVYGLLLELSTVGTPICVEFNENRLVLTPGLGKTVVEVKRFDLQLFLLLR
jgi:hypothetical protein